MAVGGIAGVLVGANLLVTGAVGLARAAELSEAVIGFTLVAVGTSLPELATSVVAAVKREGDVAFGNIVGSNIFNILGILGITTLVTPLPMPPEVVRFDLWAMLAATLLLVVFARSGARIVRREGAAFLLLYGGYLSVQFVSALRSALGLA